MCRKRLPPVWAVSLPAVILAAFLLRGCGIHEDRSDCPCYLQLDLTDVPPEVKEFRLWMTDARGEEVFRDTIPQDSIGKRITLTVPRKNTVTCSLWGNVGSASTVEERHSMQTAILKAGSGDPDPLYSCTGKVRTDTETASMDVFPRREFSQLTVTFKGARHIAVDELWLHYAVRGFYIAGGPCKGESRTRMAVAGDPARGLSYVCRMMRNRELESTFLSLKAAGEPEAVLPLGGYLLEGGYVPQANHLPDIWLELDYSSNSVTVKVDGWERHYDMSVYF